MVDVFEEKYAPKTINEFLEHTSQKRDLQDWINGKTKYKFCILCGSTGTGKTTLARLIFSKFKIIEFNDSAPKKEILSELHTIQQLNNVSHQLDDNNLKTAVIIENGETLFSDNLDRIETMLDNGRVPVIIIFSCILKKRYKNYREVLYIELSKLSNVSQFNICNKIIKSEKLQVAKTAVNKLVQGARGDLRKLFHFLRLMCIRKDTEYGDNEVDEIVEFSGADSVFEYLDIVKHVFQESIRGRGLEEKLNICYDEYQIIEQLIYSNLPETFKKTEETFENHIMILESFQFSDSISVKMHNNQFWELNEYSVIFSCVFPDKVIEKKKTAKLCKNSINNIQLNASKVRNAYRETFDAVLPVPRWNNATIIETNPKRDYILDYALAIKYILIPEWEEERNLPIQYETYSKLCNNYNLRKKSKNYFVINDE